MSCIEIPLVSNCMLIALLIEMAPRYRKHRPLQVLRYSSFRSFCSCLPGLLNSKHKLLPSSLVYYVFMLLGLGIKFFLDEDPYLTVHNIDSVFKGLGRVRIPCFLYT